MAGAGLGVRIGAIGYGPGVAFEGDASDHEPPAVEKRGLSPAGHGGDVEGCIYRYGQVAVIRHVADEDGRLLIVIDRKYLPRGVLPGLISQVIGDCHGLGLRRYTRPDPNNKGALDASRIPGQPACRCGEGRRWTVGDTRHGGRTGRCRPGRYCGQQTKVRRHRGIVQRDGIVRGDDLQDLVNRDFDIRVVYREVRKPESCARAVPEVGPQGPPGQSTRHHP